MAEIKITITGGRRNLGETLTLPLDGPILVGRSHVAGIRFANEEPGVSGQHLEIAEENGRVWVRNLKADILVNGKPLVSGDRRELVGGDSLSLGERARFRVDALYGVSSAAQPGDASTLTGETRAAEMTAATRAADMTEATRAADMTAATRAADMTEATRAADMTVATRPVEDLEARLSDAETATDPQVRPEIPLADRPTEVLNDDTSASTGPGTYAGDKTIAVPGGDGPTDKIPEWMLKKLNEDAKRKDILKRKVRQTVMAVAVLLFCAVVGGIVYLRWPKGESVLSVPLNAKGEPDVEHYVASSVGMSNAFVVDYPRNEGVKKSELANGRGIEVSTLIGKDRNVPYRLRLERWEQPEELSRSLTDCAQARMKTEEKSGTVFRSPAEWPAGVYFFESEYPKSCHSPQLQRGTRFFRSEYETVRGDVKWAGILFLFRDGETVFALHREIVAGEWERGKHLLRADANLEFYPKFLEARWESPGLENLVSKRSVEQLTAEVGRELELPNPRVSQWPRMKRQLDTLMALTWNKRPQNEAVKALFARFRRQQDKAYLQFVLNFDLAKKSGADEERLVSIREDCRRVFGSDQFDRRFLMISDPERWSCQNEN